METILIIFILITCRDVNILDNWAKENILLKLISPIADLFKMANRKLENHRGLTQPLVWQAHGFT